MNELSTINKSGVDLSVFKTDTSMSEQDKSKVREYAKLVKVQNELHNEIQKVSRLMSFLDARWCKKHLWINRNGEVIPLFDIEDDYLKNIYNWGIKNKKKLDKEVVNEYISRFGLPEQNTSDDDKYERGEDPFDEDWVF